ncbi:MAG: O-succinylhomoserine sulfhydrylase [Pseudomonadales bacterium]|nr:O-succinylhomoserine sulfhydrylase [Pseudomonadales bacterium]
MRDPQQGLDPELLDEVAFDTLAVRAGGRRSQEGEHSEALYLTSSFVYGSAEEAAARFSGTEPGNVYSRFTNPTVSMFEERLAALEGAERCVATSSGMAAILSTMLALLKTGDEVVVSRSVFGTTRVLFDKYLAKLGIATRWVNIANMTEWEAAIMPVTRVFFVETPSNPLGELVDLRALSELAHRHDILLVVDNCLCTPALQKPLQWGADIVVHSATKYLDGQGRCLGGAVLGRAQEMNEVFGFLRTCGTSLSPFNAWVFIKGLETLRLRMMAQCDRALHLARWLNNHALVEQVYYSGLPDHPQHALAQEQQLHFGAVLAFKVRGGRQAAWALINATRLFSITANLGDTKSTITHPATTTHGRLSEDDKVAAGISEGLIRLSVGLEDVSDLQQDLARGLEAVQ